MNIFFYVWYLWCNGLVDWNWAILSIWNLGGPYPVVGEDFGPCIYKLVGGNQKYELDVGVREQFCFID